MLKAAGLQDVTIDEKFNVYGKIYGSGKTGKSVLLEGHLDTVFSFGTVTDVIEKTASFMLQVFAMIPEL